MHLMSAIMSSLLLISAHMNDQLCKISLPSTHQSISPPPFLIKSPIRCLTRGQHRRHRRLDRAVERPGAVSEKKNSSASFQQDVSHQLPPSTLSAEVVVPQAPIVRREKVTHCCVTLPNLSRPPTEGGIGSARDQLRGSEVVSARLAIGGRSHLGSIEETGERDKMKGTDSPRVHYSPGHQQESTPPSTPVKEWGANFKHRFCFG